MIHILIVDDEKIERNGIKFLLKKMNIEMEILEAVNGLKALEVIEKEKVDIIITDIKMPFLDGIGLIQEVVKRWTDIKIIIFSGHGEFEYARIAMKSGVSNYILKPVDPQEFFSTMESVLKEIENTRLDNVIKEKGKTYLKEHILLSKLLRMPENIEDGSIEKKMIEEAQIGSYHYMMLVEFGSDFFGTKSNDFTDIMSQVIDIDFQYLNLNQQQGVFLFGEEISDRNKIAGDIVNKIENYYEEKCCVAVSERFESVDELSDIYEKLEILMENRFYALDDRVFIMNDISDDREFEHIEDDKLMKKIKQDIKLKDMVGLRQHFDELCEKYREKKNFSQIYVKFVFSNLLKDIYEVLPENFAKHLNEDIEVLYRANDFQNVIDILEKGIQKMESQFSANPQMVHREIETVKQYIYANYGKELSVDMLAEQVYMAPSYLSHIFKKETGQNLSKFIKSLRMEKAKEMLEESHNKIVNISYAVGYPNVSYFCQSFREYFGVSPQKYRNQGDNNDLDSETV